MTITRSLELMRRYINCPKCGNDKLGNGEGRLVVKDKLFGRECKCGWHIQIVEVK